LVGHLDPDDVFRTQNAFAEVTLLYRGREEGAGGE
jgi:hypothetical protein